MAESLHDRGVAGAGATSHGNGEAETRFRAATRVVSEGRSALVLVETESGSASQLVELIPDEIDIFSGVVCAAASRFRVGGLARDLDLDSFEGGAIIVEDAQWADPTSLGRLQRLIKDGPHPYLLVVAHRPLSDIDRWWLEQLADAAQEHSSLHSLALEGGKASIAHGDIDSKSLDLIIATRLVTEPVSVPIGASVLGVSEDEVLDIGDALVSEGLVGQARSGYTYAPGSPNVVGAEARIGNVARKLAAAMTEAGRSASLIGGLHLAAGQPDEAFAPLTAAAKEAQARHATGEAFHLAEAALEAAEDAGITGGTELGELHLICGRFLRTAGRTGHAVDHLEKATVLLEGLARVEALQFAAQVADDGQHPQEAERTIAAAQWEAIRLEDGSKLGSLLAFHARVLHRLGFADEADAALSKAEGLLQANNANADQLFDAMRDKAWIHFDRGEASLAEAEFTKLRDDAGALRGEASVADQEAWRARALFASGNPQEALQATVHAETLAVQEDVGAPIFLSHLARTEGGLAYGRYEEALEAAEQALDLVERQLPAWENMARSHRAAALLGLGRLGEARDEIAKAIEASPEGADGWRWGIRCKALQMEIAAASGEKWPDAKAEDLADLMLQSRLYGWAAELLCAIAENGKRKGAAEEALGLAVSVGLPMVAARAAEAGKLWDEPAVAPVVATMRSIEKRLPEAWVDDWRSLPHTKGALAAPEPIDSEDMEAATAAMEAAMAKAGLVGDEVLSPAQRRTRGLVRRPRRFHPIRLVAATLGIVLVAVASTFVASQLFFPEEDPTATETTLAQEPTTTIPPITEEAQLDIAAVVGSRGLFGEGKHRGGPARTGVVEFEGPREVDGYYWRVELDGPIEADLVTYGNNVYVSTTEGTLYALRMETGVEQWFETGEGKITTSPDWGLNIQSQGANEYVMIVTTEDGVVISHDATGAEEYWTYRLDDARIKSSPVVLEDAGLGIVATDDGFLYGFGLRTPGGPLWQYPAEGEPGLGDVTADLAYDAGMLYVATREGVLYMIDVSSGTPEFVCDYPTGESIVTAPVISDGVVYVTTTGAATWTMAPGDCERGSAPNRQFSYAQDYAVDHSAAVIGDTIYYPQWRYLYARDLTTSEYLWDAGDYAVTDLEITTPPVVAGSIVVIASSDGLVYAFDSTSGETLWTWNAGFAVRAAPAVIDGVVFIGTSDGFVYAIGPAAG